MEFLVDACCDYLVHQLGMENYQNVLVLADKYWLGDLRSEIFGFLGNNIIQLSEVSQNCSSICKSLAGFGYGLKVETLENQKDLLSCGWVQTTGLAGTQRNSTYLIYGLHRQGIQITAPI